MPNQVAIYDACVLYPAGLRSSLMYLGLAGLIQARWSETIHDEWIRNVLENRKDITREQLERTRQLMNTALPDASVTGYESLIETLELPDRNDRHVLAAAIHAKADVIVTFNMKDFPQSTLTSYSIEACIPDTFVGRLLRSYPLQVVEALRIDRLSKKRPPKSPEEYLDALVTQQLPQTSAELRPFLSLL